ncbi:hypothetical protein [Streptomyces gardneri]
MKQVFQVNSVQNEGGERFALGRCATDGHGVDWVVRRQHHWDDYAWEEVR